MNEMLSRIANVISKEVGHREGIEPIPAAMLVLDALREPTDAMVRAGRNGPAGDVPYDRDCVIVWCDMIDEALK